MTTANDTAGIAGSGINDVDLYIHQLLAKHHKIAAIWCIEDVKHLRPDLTDDQAWDVLEQVKDLHDAEYGISWTTLETVAYDLFGAAPKTKDEEAGV